MKLKAFSVQLGKSHVSYVVLKVENPLHGLQNAYLELLMVIMMVLLHQRNLLHFIGEEDEGYCKNIFTKLC